MPLIALAIVPAIGWILVYRYLDYRDPEPVSPTTRALQMGLFSTLPIFAMQYSFSHYPQTNFLSFLQTSIQNPILFSIAFLLFVALVEELAKALSFLFLVRYQERFFNQMVDGIVYGALIGIGFGIAENIYYFAKAVEVFKYTENFWAIFTIRSFGTMLAHTLFTGVFGFYFAKAYFAPFVNEESKQEKLWHNFRHNFTMAIRFHATFFHLLPDYKKDPTVFRRNAIIFEGYFIAVFLHLIYNTLIKVELFGKTWTFLMIPMLFLLAWYVWSQFFIHVYSKILEFIRIRKGLYRIKIR